MSAANEIVYPMSIDYVAHWDVERALAELIANAFDEDPRPVVTYQNGTLVISDRGPGWSEECLILGKSSKTTEQIGQFGEGLKLALLVLAREHREPLIETTGRTLTARIEQRPLTWGEGNTTHPLLCIRTEHPTRTPGRPRRGTRILVRCDKHEADGARERFLRLGNPRYRTPDTGRVILEEPGRIYVGGVRIARGRDLIFGYDFPLDAAKHLVNRDRDLIDGWELENLIGTTLGKAKQRDVVYEYLRAAFEHRLSTSETAACRLLGRSPESDRLWRRTATEFLRERTATPEAQTGSPRLVKVYWDERPETREIHYSLADRRWERIPATVGGYHHRELMEKIGIRHISEIGREQDRITWTARHHLSSTERVNLSLMLRRARRRTGPIPTVRIFEQHENEDLLGFYDTQKDVIAIHRSRLQSRRLLAETLVHEIAHRTAYRAGRDWQDRTRGFEQTLTEYASEILQPER